MLVRLMQLLVTLGKVTIFLLRCLHLTFIPGLKARVFTPIVG